MKLSTGYLLQLANQFIEAGQLDVAENAIAQADIYQKKAMAANPTWIAKISK